jgi:hypothetical protein
VERKGVDPFEVEVKEALDSLRQYLPKWSSFEEFCLDAEAVNELTKVIKLQGEWIKHRSSPLYVNPAMVEAKVSILTVEKLAEVLLKAWRPIIGVERISPSRLKESLRYWHSLPPRGERESDLPAQVESLTASEDELKRLRMLSDEEFNTLLTHLWKELQHRVGAEGKISYWDFIYAESYGALVRRAYLTSFLLNYGYATVEVNPIEEEIKLIPKSKPRAPTNRSQTSSLPIPLDRSTWRKLMEGHAD